MTEATQIILPELYCRFQEATLAVDYLIFLIYFFAALGFLWLFSQVISIFQGKK